MTDHCTRDGQPKLLETCTYPLTGRRVVDRIYTDVAVIDVADSGFVVREMLAEMSADELKGMTGAALAIADKCAVLNAPAL